jgi:hypothetical protein
MAAPIEPAVVRVLREHRAALLQREQTQMQAMAQRWLGVEHQLAALMDALSLEVANMRANGETITPGKLYRLQRYQDLLAETKRQVGQYTAWAGGEIQTETGRWVQQSLFTATEAIRAGYSDAKQSIPNFTVLGQPQAEALMAWSQPGAPLGDLLAASYPDAVQGMTQALINGSALGWNPVKTAREMRNGTAMGLTRSLVVARDQTLRAARTATDAEYEASGVVVAKYRIVAKDGKACLACLARDGEIIPLNRPGYDHTCGRCTFAPQLLGVPDLTWQKGYEWFATLPADRQRAMMGGKLFEAWRDGRFQLTDLAATTHHHVWGDGLRVKSLQELGVARVPPPPKTRPQPAAPPTVAGAARNA